MAPHVGRAPLKKRTAAAACFSPAYRVSSWRHGAETDLAATYIVDDVVKAQVFMADLLRVRRGLEGIFQSPAAANDRRDQRPAREGHAGGDRSDRHPVERVLLFRIAQRRRRATPLRTALPFPAVTTAHYGHARTAMHWISNMVSGVAKPLTVIAALAGKRSPPNSAVRNSVIRVV